MNLILLTFGEYQMSYENATIGRAGAHQIQRTIERRSPEQGHSLALAGLLLALKWNTSAGWAEIK
jgi:hypothetical protein